MKYLLLAALVISAWACKKDCIEPECENQNEACTHTVPTDELCTAAFQRWFYDANTKSCEQMNYSGCNTWGFESQTACEACKCHD